MENIKYVYDKHGIANAFVEEGDKKYRVRVETLILKGKKVLINKTGKLNQYGRYYKIPGGSIEPGMTLEESAKKECREEVLMNVKDMEYYLKIKNKYTKIPEWHKKILWPLGLKYEGSITYVFIGRYDSKYNGYIAPEDQEAEMLNSKFYDLDDAILCPEHRKVLNRYLERR